MKSKKNNNFIITGSSGYVASELVPRLKKFGSVFGFDLLPSSNTDFVGDIGDEKNKVDVFRFVAAPSRSSAFQPAMAGAPSAPAAVAAATVVAAFSRSSDFQSATTAPLSRHPLHHPFLCRHRHIPWAEALSMLHIDVISWPSIDNDVISWHMGRGSELGSGNESV